MVRSWNEFDERLREMAEIDLAVGEAARLRDAAAIEAEAAFKSATALKTARRAAIEKDLEKFYRANRKEVEKGGKRSVELMFGRAGIRATAAKVKVAKGWKMEGVLIAIKDMLGRSLLKTKETLDKEAVKKAALTDEQLAAVGLTIKTSERFFVETFPEKLRSEKAVV